MQRLMRVAGAAVMLAAVLVLAARADEVPLDKVPKAVKDAVKKRFPDAKLESASKEVEDKKTFYDLSIDNKGQNIDVRLTPAGEIVEFNRSIEVGELPKEVKKTFDEKYPKTTVNYVEEVVKVEKTKETVTHYEFEIVTEGKKKLEVHIAKDGKFIKAEEKKEDKGEPKKDK